MVGAVGLEPTVLLATELQSAGVTNFPTHPLYVCNRESIQQNSTLLDIIITEGFAPLHRNLNHKHIMVDLFTLR